jgi:hypothetical protein
MVRSSFTCAPGERIGPGFDGGPAYPGRTREGKAKQIMCSVDLKYTLMHGARHRGPILSSR